MRNITLSGVNGHVSVVTLYVGQHGSYSLSVQHTKDMWRYREFDCVVCYYCEFALRVGEMHYLNNKNTFYIIIIIMYFELRFGCMWAANIFKT